MTFQYLSQDIMFSRETAGSGRVVAGARWLRWLEAGGGRVAGGRWLEGGWRSGRGGWLESRLVAGGGWTQRRREAGGWRQVAGGWEGEVAGGWLQVWLEWCWVAVWLVWWDSVLRIATEPNRNSTILAIHIPLNTAYVLVSTEPPDYNHVHEHALNHQRQQLYPLVTAKKKNNHDDNSNNNNNTQTARNKQKAV